MAESVPAHALLAAENLALAEALYERYRHDPASVDADWRSYFDRLETLERASAPVLPATRPAPASPAPLTPAAATAAALPSDPTVAAYRPFIARVALFRDLSPEQQSLIAAAVTRVELKEGEVLFRIGDAGDALYIVTLGSLRIERNGRVLARIGTGEVTGELAVVDGKPRSADVVAHEDAILLRLAAADFDVLLTRHAQVAHSLFRVLSERLRQTNAQQEKVDALARAYRTQGHSVARLDPLGRGRTSHPELELEHHGLQETDLDLPFAMQTGRGTRTLPLAEIVRILKNTYCRTIGVQYMHVDSQEVRDWLQWRMESTENRRGLSLDEQRRILGKLTDAEFFETFVHKKFLGAKRFSLEGGESLIPLLDVAIEEAAVHGVEEVVIGMAHRGRLNVLANIMGKSPRRIFEEFKDADPEKHLGGGGDVKYHMGFSSDRSTAHGKDVHLSLCFNPSHLAVVGPVVLGRVRAKQDRLGDTRRKKVMGVVIHGDAAFAGQGVIQEILNMSALPGYRTGGTVHIIVNNQVGFTTDPEDSRSSPYATDFVRALETPIFHVNGEDPEAVVQVIALAMAFRAEFARDVVIDMYCYRRHGHNEGDEPTFTQPVMYQWISRQPPVRENYVASLQKLGGLGEAEAKQIAEQSLKRLEEELASVEARPTPTASDAVKTFWRQYRGGVDGEVPEVATAVPQETLWRLLKQLTAVPEDFHPHPKIARFLETREEMAAGAKPLDWGAAEALAFATLLDAGVGVRLSGQDAGRGTFTHRHAVMHDVEDGHRHVPLQKLGGTFEVWNSPLSETGVLGFDWGYSLDSPDRLVIWEAQFGDFANVAQVIIDQFVSSAEQKWKRLSALVLLLPHGFEGQGPEHSSARLERFLAMAARDNLQVVNLTTPAQIFHALRRQIVRPIRKPMVVMSPKSLLRHPSAVSSLADLHAGGYQKVIADASGRPAAEARSLLLCTGKVYYDLAKAREDKGASDVHVARVEQLYPLPEAELAALVAQYGPAVPVTWVQEEPVNMGAWGFLRMNLGAPVLGARSFTCVARAESASPATGSGASHKYEQQMLLQQALA